MVRLDHTPTMLAPAARRYAREEAVKRVVDRLAAGEITATEFEAEKALAELDADVGFAFSTAEHVEELAERVARSRSAHVRSSDVPLVPYVSDGRWVADCQCGSGVACSPQHDRAACLDCLTIYRRLEFPDELDRIEDALLARPSANRHWKPPETVSDLLEENFRQGHGSVSRP